MSENSKIPDKSQEFLSLPADDGSGDSSQESAQRTEPAHIQDVEAQMRRALGLFGAPRRADPERAPASSPPRAPDRFGAAGHKRRFVQDGEVPVTVLHGRREHPPAEASTNRLEAVEAAFNNERVAREKADRALAESAAIAHDLRTKLGHASLAQQELQAAAERESAKLAALQAELREVRDRLAGAEQRLAAAEEEVAGEHDARIAAERARRVSESAREEAERLVRELELHHDGPIELPARRAGRASRAAVRPEDEAPQRLSSGGIHGEPDEPGDEPGPEPVQWWLLPEKKIRRR